MSEAKKAMTVDEMLANIADSVHSSAIRDDLLTRRELVKNVRRFAQSNSGRSVDALTDNLRTWENNSKYEIDKTTFQSRHRLISEVETLREDLRSAQSKLSALLFVLASTLVVSIVFFAHYFS